MLVDSCYYKADYEDRKWPWQKEYVSWKIAQQEKGGHSHEELTFDYTVIIAMIKKFPAMAKVISEHEVLGYALKYQLTVCASSSGRDGGVRFKLARDVLKFRHKWDIEDVTDIMYKAITMLQFFIREDGKDYDFKGVSGFKLSFLGENPLKWYCSEICDKAKQIVGLWPKFYRSHPSASYWTQAFLVQVGIMK